MMTLRPVRESFLPFSPPSLGEEEIAEVADTLRSDWITTGPKAKLFEEEFAEFIGASGALAVNSGTAALHLALIALGVGAGDLVLTTPMTFCSTAHVIEHLNALPVLVDVEPDTLCVDPHLLALALKRLGNGENGVMPFSRDQAVKAIMPVHYAGHPCEMEAIRQLAAEEGLAVIEDAAHALPARYKSHLIGENVSDAAESAVAFSFYATKNLTTAEGGMLIASKELLDEARVWSLHGMSRDAYRRYASEGSWYYEVVRPGFKYNMTDIQAAIGLQQLRKLPEFHRRRQQIARRYNEAFSQFPELDLPTERPETEASWHLYVLRLDTNRLSISRKQFIERLKALNIGASVHFIPLHLHPYYKTKYGYQADDFPVAYREYLRMVSLPIYPRMTDQDVDDVIEAVVQIVQEGGRGQ